MNYVNLNEFGGSTKHIPFEVNIFNISTKSIDFTTFSTTPIAFEITPKNIGVKCHMNAFSPLIETMNKNIKWIVEAMDQINLT